MIGFQTAVSSTVVNGGQKRALLDFYTAKHGSLRTGFEKVLSPHETTDVYKASGIESLFSIGKGDYLNWNPLRK